MRFSTLAIVAGATLVAAEAQPYRLAVMPGLSLMRRDSPGYQPEKTKCGDGDTCAEACGAGFEQCASDDGVAHCFNPTAKQSCCQDGSGSSCDEGYYCTHDTSQQTWCCPNDMDLAACAAAYTVAGGLKTAEPKPTTTTQAPKPPKVTTKVTEHTTTVCASSSGHSTAWTGSNSTITTGVPTGVPTGKPTVIPVTSQPPAVLPTGTSAAAATSFSALLVVAAGVVALL
ncbi:hypothetical protein K4F52_003733 [Lecanicillium sp. MT-2017a]|nr:hypothetical protein K4F52_003733 [Lecanicillium sp. MT-2017a]